MGAACMVSTCRVCPMCSHLVLLKVLISQPGLIYVAGAAVPIGEAEHDG